MRFLCGKSCSRFPSQVPTAAMLKKVVLARRTVLAPLQSCSENQLCRKMWKVVKELLVLRRVQSDVTGLEWHGLVFDELTNGQARR